jgi:RND family efflux transporter MFP subunit
MKIQTRVTSLIFLCLFLYCSHFPALAEETETSAILPTVQVKVADVIQDYALSQTEVVGTVQAVQRAVIAAKISGTISEMPVVLGSKVEQGDLLVKITADEISARVLQAQAQLEQARRNLERENKLLEKKAATTETVKSMEDVYRVALASFQETKTMLDYTSITAPFKGMITSKSANTGDLALPGMPLLHLENNEKLQIEAPVPEELVLSIKQGDRLDVHVPAAGARLIGTVAEVSPAADPLSRTTPIKIDIDETELLRSGQFARVQLQNTPEKAFYISENAVIRHGQMEIVFLVEGNKARLRLIRTGARHQGLVEVLAGLDATETVIIENNNHLVDGQTVNIIP